MKEAKTLKEWLGDATRSSGRKFTRIGFEPEDYFEPLFLNGEYWHGCCNKNAHDYFDENVVSWLEWTPPVKTKKVKMYSPIVKHGKHFDADYGWNTDKERWFELEIVGWMEMECEVTDD